MKTQVKDFKQNQKVWALVEEVIAQGEVIINFSGDLVRVKNETGKLLRTGQRVQVRIDETQPLKLSLVAPQLSRSYLPLLDVSI